MYDLPNLRLSWTDRSGRSWKSPRFGIPLFLLQEFRNLSFCLQHSLSRTSQIMLGERRQTSWRDELTSTTHLERSPPERPVEGHGQGLGMRTASPSLADISSSSVTMLIGTCRGGTKESPCVWSARICQPDSWICIQSGPNDWSGTPQDARVSVRRNQGSGHLRQVLMCHCSSQCTYPYVHCDLTCMTSPSPAQKTHLHPRVKWSVHFHFLNVCSLLFVICCFSICVFSCCVLLMHHDLLSNCLITLQCTVYKLLYTSALFSIYVVRVRCLLYSFTVLMTLSSSYFLFINLCLPLSTAYLLQPTLHNVQLSVFGMLRSMFYDVLHTNDCLLFIIHWTLFTAYSSQSDSSVFAIYRPVSSFDAK